MFSMLPYRTNSDRNHNVHGYMSPFADDFFREFFREAPAAGELRVDVKDEGDHYLLEADLPGVTKDNLHIDVENNVMTISAEVNETHEENRGNYICRERRSGTFRRAFNLDGVREDAITAEYRDGVLRLNLPKAAEAPAPRRIEIQ